MKIIGLMINEKSKFEYTELVQDEFAALEVETLLAMNLGAHAAEASDDRRQNFAMDIIKFLRNNR